MRSVVVAFLLVEAHLLFGNGCDVLLPSHAGIDDLLTFILN